MLARKGKHKYSWRKYLREKQSTITNWVLTWNFLPFRVEWNTPWNGSLKWIYPFPIFVYHWVQERVVQNVSDPLDWPRRDCEQKICIDTSKINEGIHQVGHRGHWSLKKDVNVSISIGIMYCASYIGINVHWRYVRSGMSLRRRRRCCKIFISFFKTGPTTCMQVEDQMGSEIQPFLALLRCKYLWMQFLELYEFGILVQSGLLIQNESGLPHFR